MPHILAARPTASARRGRVLAPLIGVLALLLALFAMTAPAGAKARHATEPPAGKPPAQKYDDEAGKPKDVKHQDKPKEQDKPGKPEDEDKQDERKHDDKQDERKHEDKQDKPKNENEDHGKPDDKAECDSYGAGNPCHPPQQCGQVKGHTHAMGHTQGKGHHKHHGKGKHRKHDDHVANCPPPKDVECEAGQVTKDGMCAPADECKPGEVAMDGKCVAADECKSPNQVVYGKCVPPNDEECKPPNVVVDGKCVPPNDNDNQGCPAGTVPQNGQCVTPPVVCTSPQVLQNGQCVTPATNNVVVQQTPAAPATQAAPNAAPNAAPSANQPTTQVAGTRAAAATARLRTQSRCGARAFRVTISGRSLRRVTLFVAGRRVRTVTVPAGRRSITVSVPVRRFGARRQSVRARVTFRNGAAARTLTASATRCAQTQVSPQFTG